jgi:ABC-type multidrug transport system fused ATPase/permease subunit
VESVGCRIISSLQNDVPIISDTVGATVTLLRLLLIMNASFILLLLLNWRLGLLCLVSFPLYFVSFRRNSINTSRSAFLYRSMVRTVGTHRGNPSTQSTMADGARRRCPQDKKYISLMDELLRHWTCIRTLGSSERALGKLQESAVSTRTIAATGKLHNAVGTTNNQAIGYLQNFFLLVIGTYFMIYTNMPVPIFMAFYVAAGKLDAQMPKVASCLATLNQVSDNTRPFVGYRTTSSASVHFIRPPEPRAQEPNFHGGPLGIGEKP